MTAIVPRPEGSFDVVLASDYDALQVELDARDRSVEALKRECEGWNAPYDRALDRAAKAEAALGRVKALPTFNADNRYGDVVGPSVTKEAIDRAIAGEAPQKIQFRRHYPDGSVYAVSEGRTRSQRGLDRLVDLGPNERPVYHEWDRRKRDRRRA